ncbi:MAG: alpha-xylosidase, partial [Chitinophagaceae bacterium]|nr:alpha-xylosidase [Chitinophagaceae bacterium]
MKAAIYRFFLFFILSHTFHFSNAIADEKRYKIESDGVMIYPDRRFSPEVAEMKLQVITGKIIRVLASSSGVAATYKEVITLAPAGATFTTSVNDSSITIKASGVNAIANFYYGTVYFTDANGNRLLTERSLNGKNITPVIWEGQSLNRLRQSFELTTGEAIYGLGQHQEDAFNYRDQQVVLFQNNTEVAVPFMISSKNYGVLWHNASYTKAGDIRSFLPLSSLQLFDRNNNAGWLTATYRNDRSKPGEIAFEKAESVIDYPYLGDTKMKLPANFTIQKGSITWDGSIASPVTGQHKFRFTYAGYIKVWIDGKLLLDKWRQAWNPGAGVINLSMEKDKKQNIKIEWIPDGGESYLTANWLPPADKGWENTFSFDSEAGRQIDYFVVAGNDMDEVINGYRELTGKAPIVPKWAMGFWQSRERYKTQAEILNTA